MDALVRWSLRIWTTVLTVAALWWLWKVLPFGLVLLLLLITWGLVTYRREIQCRQGQGYWVEFLGPSRLDTGDDQFAVVYREGEKSLWLYGKDNTLSVPRTEQWHKTVPVWAHEKRDVIVARVAQDLYRQRLQRKVNIVDEAG